MRIGFSQPRTRYVRLPQLLSVLSDRYPCRIGASQENPRCFVWQKPIRSHSRLFGRDLRQRNPAAAICLPSDSPRASSAPNAVAVSIMSSKPVRPVSANSAPPNLCYGWYCDALYTPSTDGLVLGDLSLCDR